MYKYEIVANEIVSYLRDQQRDGNRSFVLNAKDVERLFNVSERCGASSQSRYPLICQAMNKASETFTSTWIDGKCPSSTYTVEYRLKLF